MRKLVASLAIAAIALLSGSAAFAAPRPPAQAASVSSAADTPGRPAASPSIIDVTLAVNASGPYAGQFDTLIALVTMYPDLVSTLSSKGQYTVFAPTDAAFDALFAVVDPASLSSDQIEDVLLYHVTRGARDAADVTSSSQIRMLNGDFAQVSGATIDGAGIIIDVFAGNGVIHVVDAVLLPPALG